MDNWAQHCPTHGQLGTALSNHWTIERITVHPCPHDAVQLLDTLAHHHKTHGQLGIALSNKWTIVKNIINYWTVGYSTANHGNLTEYCTIIGQFGTVLCNHFIDGHSLSNSWTVWLSTA